MILSHLYYIWSEIWYNVVDIVWSSQINHKWYYIERGINIIPSACTAQVKWIHISIAGSVLAKRLIILMSKRIINYTIVQPSSAYVICICLRCNTLINYKDKFNLLRTLLGNRLFDIQKICATKQTKRVMVTFNDFNQFVDLQECIDLEKRYSWLIQ
jgi:hypothetical protein